MKRLSTLCASILFLLLLCGSLLGAQEAVRHERGFLSGGRSSADLSRALTEGMTEPVLFITHNGAQWLPRPVGVSSDGRNWSITTLDGGTAMRNTVVWVMAIDGARADSAFVHTTTAESVINHMTILDHPATNKNPDAILSVTVHAGPGSDSTAGLMYDGERWLIFNEDGTPMQAGRRFSVLVIDRDRSSPLADLVYADLVSLTPGRFTLQAHEADLPLRDGEEVSLFLTHVVGFDHPSLSDPLSARFDGTSWVAVNSRMVAIRPGTLLHVIAIRRAPLERPFPPVVSGNLRSSDPRAEVGGFAYSFGAPDDLRSTRSDTSVRLTFKNERQKPATIYWVDYQGNRVEYGRLQPGERRDQDSYATHVWELHSDGEDRFIFIADDRPEQEMAYFYVEK